MKTKGIGVLNYINSVCRVCLKKETGLVPIGEVNFVHTFNSDGREEDISLSEVLLKYCNVSVANLDQKPQQICPGCMNTMCQAFHVFELFLQSNLFLDKLLVKDEKIDEEEEEEEEADISREDENGSNHPIEHLDLPSVKVDREEEEVEEYENEEYLESAEGDEYVEDEEMPSPENADNELIDDEVEFVEDSSEEVKSKKGDEEHDYCDGKNQQGETVVIEEIMEEELEEVDFNPEEEVVENNEEEFDNLLEAHDLFKCRFCPTILDGIEKVIKHLKEQHLEDKRCILCPKAFRTESFLLFHVASHSSNGLVCKICALYFEDTESFEAHNNEFDHTESLACPQCKIKFPNFTKKQTHMEEVHGKEYTLKQQCSTCGMILWKHNMKKHERKHKHQTTKFICQTCGKCFAAKNRLEHHVQVVHEKRSDLLEKLKMQRKKYNKNKNKSENGDDKEAEPEDFECIFCGRKFNLRHAFLKHCMSHPEYKSVKCPYCDDVLDSAQNYRKHRELMHSSFVCDICGKGYPNKYLLSAHVNLHVRKFKCDICSKEFNRIYSLENHRRIHTGERPYKCQYCPKAFKQQAQVTQHIMTMHTEKSYKCKVCGKAFNFPYTLQAHMRSHTGEKPFGCLYCGSHFRDTVNRHKHVKQKHPERMEEFLEYKKNYQEKESKDLMMKYDDM